MKKYILSLILIASFCILNAQSDNPVNILKTKADSVSYVLGEVVALSMKEKGLGDLKITNSTAFMRALNDILGKKQVLIDDASANALLNDYMSKLQTEKLKLSIEAGNIFLAKNKINPGIITTASGLQYEIIKEGTGIKPAAKDTFVCNYRGTLLDGSEFDASYNRGVPLRMAVNQVIAGWTEGLQLMSVGSKYLFWIPYNLGYGTNGNGPKIPGGSLLKFEVELLDVIKAK